MTTWWWFAPTTVSIILPQQRLCVAGNRTCCIASRRLYQSCCRAMLGWAGEGTCPYATFAGLRPALHPARLLLSENDGRSRVQRRCGLIHHEEAGYRADRSRIFGGTIAA